MILVITGENGTESRCVLNETRNNPSVQHQQTDHRPILILISICWFKMSRNSLALVTTNHRIKRDMFILVAIIIIRSNLMKYEL